MFINIKQKFIFIFIILLNGLNINNLFSANVSSSHVGSSGLTAQQQKLKDAIEKYGQKKFLGESLLDRIKIPLDQLVKNINQNAQPPVGNTLLILAFQTKSDKPFIELLLEHGADPLITFRRDELNALDYSNRYSTFETKNLLLKKIYPEVEIFTLDELNKMEVFFPAGLFSISLRNLENFEQLKKENLITFDKNNKFVKDELVIIPAKLLGGISGGKATDGYFSIILKQVNTNEYEINETNKDGSNIILKSEQIGKFSINQTPNENNLIIKFPLQIIKIPASQAIGYFNAVGIAKHMPFFNNLEKSGNLRQETKNYFYNFFDFNKENEFHPKEIVGFANEGNYFFGIILHPIPNNKYLIQFGSESFKVMPAEKIGKFKFMETLGLKEAAECIRGFCPDLPQVIEEVLQRKSNPNISAIKKAIQYAPENVKEAIDQLEKALGPINPETNKRQFLEFLDENKNTPLLYAVYLNKPVLVKYLIKQGADTNAKNKDDLNAIDLATQYLKSDEMVNTIVNAINERNKNKK